DPHYSTTPLLHYSTTPLLHYSTTPLLHYSRPKAYSPSTVSGAGGSSTGAGVTSSSTSSATSRTPEVQVTTTWSGPCETCTPSGIARSATRSRSPGRRQPTSTGIASGRWSARHWVASSLVW